jgi:hypothetical protein
LQAGEVVDGELELDLGVLHAKSITAAKVGLGVGVLWMIPFMGLPG